MLAMLALDLRDRQRLDRDDSQAATVAHRIADVVGSALAGPSGHRPSTHRCVV